MIAPSFPRLAQDVEAALANNIKSAAGILAPRRVFTTPAGPSGGSELLSVVSIDDRWGAPNWYGHVFRNPDTGKYVSGLFYTAKLLNGANDDILFRRLYHWTVIEPDIGGTLLDIAVDCCSDRPTFEEAVADLCTVIAGFDRNMAVRGITLDGCTDLTKYRLLHAYCQWGDLDETMEEYSFPPDNPKVDPEEVKQQVSHTLRKGLRVIEGTKR